MRYIRNRLANIRASSNNILPATLHMVMAVQDHQTKALLFHVQAGLETRNPIIHTMIFTGMKERKTKVTS